MRIEELDITRFWFHWKVTSKVMERQPEQQAFPFGFGAKKDWGTRILVLATRKMEQEHSRSLFFAPKPHRNACYAG